LAPAFLSLFKIQIGGWEKKLGRGGGGVSSTFGLTSGLENPVGQGRHLNKKKTPSCALFLRFLSLFQIYLGFVFGLFLAGGGKKILSCLFFSPGLCLYQKSVFLGGAILNGPPALHGGEP